MRNPHINFVESCIAESLKTFGVPKEDKHEKVKWCVGNEEYMANLGQIMLRAIDAMTEEEFDTIMFPIRMAKRFISHDPTTGDYDPQRRIVVRKTKTFTGSKDNVLNQEIKKESEIFSD